MVPVGGAKVLRHRLKGSKPRVDLAGRRITKALRRDRKVRAVITVKLTDPAGNVLRVKQVVRIV